MNVLEIIGGIALILCSIAIIFLVTIQDQKNDGISSAIMGGSENSAVNGRGNSNQDKMIKATKVCGYVFFAVAFIVNIIVAIANK